MRVLLGHNEFENTAGLISLDGDPLLVVQLPPLSVQFFLFPPGQTPLRILNSELAESAPGFQLRSHADELRLFYDEHLALVVSQLEAELAHVHIDLRPFGLRIFDDPEGLHFGSQTVFGLRFSGHAPAISVESSNALIEGGQPAGPGAG